MKKVLVEAVVSMMITVVVITAMFFLTKDDNTYTREMIVVEEGFRGTVLQDVEGYRYIYEDEKLKTGCYNVKVYNHGTETRLDDEVVSVKRVN